MPNPLPPLEPGIKGMTRRNYLVERNRRRVAAFEPTRLELEAEDRKAAERRAAEREEQMAAWNKTRGSLTVNGTAKAARPLPGGGPRSQQRKAAAAQHTENTIKLEKMQATKQKEEYQRLYRADMQEQLAAREAALSRARAEEARQMKELKRINAEEDRLAAESDRKYREEAKAYMDRMRQSNLKELEAKRAERRRQEEADVQMMRQIHEANQAHAEMEDRQAKNVVRMLQLQNEEFHRMTIKKVEETKARDAAEMEAMMARDRQLAEAERRSREAKKENFRKEFDATVEREKEFRRTHNYDEPAEFIRQRNELAAQSNRLIRQEERLREAQRRQEYERDLMKQIEEKQQYEITHIDGL